MSCMPCRSFLGPKSTCIEGESATRAPWWAGPKAVWIMADMVNGLTQFYSLVCVRKLAPQLISFVLLPPSLLIAQMDVDKPGICWECVWSHFCISFSFNHGNLFGHLPAKHPAVNFGRVTRGCAVAKEHCLIDENPHSRFLAKNGPLAHLFSAFLCAPCRSAINAAPRGTPC